MAGIRERRPAHLPDVFDWIESGLTGIPLWRGVPGAHDIRIEAELTEDAYRVHAELPGLDPEKDIEISIDHDVLTLKAERGERTETTHHTEFRYGTLVRSTRLPAGARTDETTASYKDGILTVTVPLAGAHKTPEKTVPVQRG
ncbi:Hsp20/alpha crystallin family protein [Streptomyces sp. NPDC048172]|uniref:Hsp20/alpha crystallin family protein n=1 Tax=Streptomyces sp. NPDC048172 TaxID=3365505 RepID=UPI003710916C